MNQDQPVSMREGSFEDFKAWVQQMDQDAKNWEQLDEDIEKLSIHGEKVMAEEHGTTGRIPRSRVLIQFLFNWSVTTGAAGG